jgi:hypothetical protein
VGDKDGIADELAKLRQNNQKRRLVLDHVVGDAVKANRVPGDDPSRVDQPLERRRWR